jgi:hypothetical protein
MGDRRQNPEARVIGRRSMAIAGIGRRRAARGARVTGGRRRAGRG